MESGQEKQTYIDILIQSLEKKIEVLNQIVQVNQVQHDDLENPNLTPEEFDKTVEEKTVLLERLEQLDTGFEEVFQKVREELNEKRQDYKDEIQTMQNLIRMITEKSVEIQTQESRNKTLMTQKFASVRKQVREVRQSQKVVNQYYKNMMKTNYVDSQFLDNKK